MSTKRFSWSFPAWMGLLIVGLALLVNWILGFFHGDLGGNEVGRIILRIVEIIIFIVRLIGFLFLFVYAYNYVDSKPSQKKKMMWIFYWVCVVIVVFTQIWDIAGLGSKVGLS